MLQVETVQSLYWSRGDTWKRVIECVTNSKTGKHRCNLETVSKMVEQFYDFICSVYLDAELNCSRLIMCSLRNLRTSAYSVIKRYGENASYAAILICKMVFLTRNTNQNNDYILL